MLHLQTLLILVIAFVVQTYLIKRLKGKSIILTASLLFIFNISLFIVLLGALNPIDDHGTMTSLTALDSMISLNTLNTKIRNSAIIVGLAVISYGLYEQNELRKSRLFLYSSYLMAGVTFLIAIMMIMAGGFII